MCGSCGNKAFVFKKSDISDLKDKIQQACDNSGLVGRLKSQAADFICNKYDWDDVVKKNIESLWGKRKMIRIFAVCK